MTSKSSKASKKKADSFLWQAFCVIIGSIPMILMVLCIAYIFNKEYVVKKNNFWAKSIFFSRQEPGSHYEEVPCVEIDYRKDRRDFKECAPKHCARLFTDFVVTDDEADFLLELAKKGFAYGGSSGGASIFDIHSGVVSMNNSFISIKNILKEQGKNLLTPEEIEGFNKIKNKILDTIKSKFSVENVYLTKPVFFSQITDKPAQTMHDEYWHEHIDKKQYEGFHYTSLVYLNGHQTEYLGGRFFWTNIKDNTTLSFEPRKARISVFTSGSENPHYVEKVISGVRYAITIPFTCNEKLAINIE